MGTLKTGSRLPPISFGLHGKHTITIGGNFAYDQLNVRNEDENHASLETKTFTSFLTGLLP